MEKARTVNRPLLLRGLLLLALLLFGLWQGWQAQVEMRQAQMRRLGLQDNSGRLATLRLAYPTGEKTPPFEALLVYERDYSRYRPLVEARRLSVFTYLAEVRPAPVRLSPPHREAVYLSGEGVVVGRGACPQGRDTCTLVPFLPYRGLLELVDPLNPPMGGSLEVVDYGDYVR